MRPEMAKGGKLSRFSQLNTALPLIGASMWYEATYDEIDHRRWSAGRDPG